MAGLVARSANAVSTLTKQTFVLLTTLRAILGFVLNGANGRLIDMIAMSWETRVGVDTLVIGVVGGFITMTPMAYLQYHDHQGS